MPLSLLRHPDHWSDWLKDYQIAPRGIWAASVGDAPLEMSCERAFPRPTLSYNWEGSGVNQANYCQACWTNIRLKFSCIWLGISFFLFSPPILHGSFTHTKWPQKMHTKVPNQGIVLNNRVGMANKLILYNFYSESNNWLRCLSCGFAFWVIILFTWMIISILA